MKRLLSVVFATILTFTLSTPMVFSQSARAGEKKQDRKEERKYGKEDSKLARKAGKADKKVEKNKAAKHRKQNRKEHKKNALRY
jgi:hypothetical protein